MNTVVEKIPLHALIGETARKIAVCSPRKRSKLKAILRMIPFVESSAGCLDIGTAHGGLAYYFTKSGSWTYLDFDASNLQVASTILKGQFYNGDAVQFLASKHTFELITCIDTIMYIEDPALFLRNVHSSLAPNGQFLISGTYANDRSILIKLRRLLGLEEALKFRTNPNFEEVKKMVVGADLALSDSADFCGVFTEALQTLLDFYSVKNVKKNDLTLQLSEMEHALPSPVLLRLLRGASLICSALDTLSPFRRKFGFLILAGKK